MKEKEKATERYLNQEVKKRRGMSIKLLSMLYNGLPDRMVLMPGGKIFFAEIKSEGRKTTMIQNHVHAQLRKLGFHVYIIDTKEQVEQVIQRYM